MEKYYCGECGKAKDAGKLRKLLSQKIQWLIKYKTEGFIKKQEKELHGS